jgi:hypothetical protein
MPASTKGGPREVPHDTTASAAITQRPTTFKKGVDQQPPGFFEQSIGCAGVGVMADPTNTPIPRIMAIASSNFRIEALPRLSNRTRDGRSIVSGFKQGEMHMRELPLHRMATPSLLRRARTARPHPPRADFANSLFFTIIG